MRAHAATAASGGVLTGAGALFAWGALDAPPADLRVAAPPGAHMLLPTRTRVFRPQAGTPHGEWNATRVALPAWAVIHTWTDPRRPSPIGDVLAALQRRITTVTEVEAMMRQMPRVRGRAGLLDVLAGFEAGADSFLEYEGLRRTFAAREFARFVRRHLVVARGRRRWLDMYDGATRTAVELDGSRFHLPGERRAADDERDADLATIGIQTIRLPYRAVMHRPEWCRATVREVLAARSRGSGSTERNL